MSSKRKIAFLLNPNSGNKRTRMKGSEMQQFLKSNHIAEVIEPANADELTETTAHLAEKNYEAVFACGGDGTLNLVSSKLLNSDTALGIIPLGSGNGFARHHHIPMKWQDAIKLIDTHRVSLRDTGRFNGIHFLNIAGVGYAAKISHGFKDSSGRGLSGYVSTVLKNLKIEAFEINVSNESAMWNGAVWMIEFCNGSQWGNDFQIAPGARDDDGSLNAAIFADTSKLKIPSIGFKLATKKADTIDSLYRMTGSWFEMAISGTRPLHLDGEAVGFVKDTAVIEVVHNSLKLWTPA
jgi:YegS/Rv2252/BmrU family lipid kinase